MRPRGLPSYRQPTTGSQSQTPLPLQKEITMKTATSLLQQFVRDEDGVTAIEYGLIAALIAVVIIASVQAVGTNLSTVFSTIASAL
jgi:pilus assembly protein Flp/PilA